jgi:hypothetical protein
MGNKVSMEDELINLKMTSKQMVFIALCQFLNA